MASNKVRFNEITIQDSAILYESDHTRIMRIYDAGGMNSVIQKERFGDHAAGRVQNERRLLTRLEKVAHVPHLVPVEGHCPDNVLFMEDSQSVPLHTVFSMALPTQQLLAFAIQITHILQQVHQAGIVHKDISCANILVNRDTLQPTLIDFDLSTTIAEERPAFVHPREIAGSLPYLAPEQTGRMGRSQDQRADLYSLGAVLYELACGLPLFLSEDPLQVIHWILAQYPASPLTHNPDLPPALADIVMRLLQKEPDRRYQSAEGLLYDLSYLSRRWSQKDGQAFELGTHDFPTHIAPPSRLVGREAEIETLRTALHNATTGNQHGLLVAGPPGVGKTAFVNELRYLVAAHNGWFISGKFDQYHDSAEDGPILKIMSSLIHLLLVESQYDVDAYREALLKALGRNAALMAAFDPKMANLLNVAPEFASGDPLVIHARKQQATLDLIRVIAGPERPLVIVLDDLQWADASSLTFIDAVLMDSGLQGVLLVGVYRDETLNETHPLNAMIARLRQHKLIPKTLQLLNLPPESLDILLAEVLRLPPEKVAPLGKVIAEHTKGNPYDTVELLNALRQDRILVPNAKDWQWDIDAIRRYVSDSTVLDFLTDRIEKLPDTTQHLLEAMACLGNDCSLALLALALDRTESTIDSYALPALEAGLLVLEQNQVAFKHDRVQQAAYDHIDETLRPELQHLLARRLAKESLFEGIAAELYLTALGSVSSSAERSCVIGLFERTAAKLFSLLNYVKAEQFLSEALKLRRTTQGGLNQTQHRATEVSYHAVLYSLGRLDEADRVYGRIMASQPEITEVIDVLHIHIGTLIARGRPQEALTLGFSTLATLGFGMPNTPEDQDAAIHERMDTVYRWLNGQEIGGLEAGEEVVFPECRNVKVKAAGRLMDYMIPAALFTGNVPALNWLVLESWRLWLHHGPCAELVSPASHAAFALVPLREDYRSAYQANQHILSVASRHYKSAFPDALFVYAVGSCYWIEPYDKCLSTAQRARELLLQEGRVFRATFTFRISVSLLFESAPRLAMCASEAEQAIAMVKRTGNKHLLPSFLAYRLLIKILSGQQPVPSDESSGEDPWRDLNDAVKHNPSSACLVYQCQALQGAILGDVAQQLTYSAVSMEILPFTTPNHTLLLSYLLRALALTAALPQATQADRLTMTKEFSNSRHWLAQRAKESPENFGHLLDWVDGEYAAVSGNHQEAMTAFDRAMRDDAESLKGFYKPLILERIGLYYHTFGARQVGLALLARARDEYGKWGASTKVKQMEQTFDFPVSRTQGEQRNTASQNSGALIAHSESIDMLAILRASQMLSSETNLARLETKLVELLGSLTGATKVSLLLPDEEANQWMARKTASNSVWQQSLEVGKAGERGFLPLTAFEYGLNHTSPLLVRDATQDERFIADPYFNNLECCSLMVVPIFNQGERCAILLLENTLSRGIFRAPLLDTVSLVTGQLAVSLKNAHLYASLEQKVRERTVALERANSYLAALSVTDALTSLPNRRHLEVVLESEWVRAFRERVPLSVAMIDIDQFKQYNDCYGHQQGDICLRETAQSLKRTMRRSSEIVARYGGEEFIVVLPNTNQAGALVVAERLRATVEALGLPHEQSRHGQVTVSIGVATMVPDNEQTVSDLIELADNRLYLAKELGRNRVESEN